MQASAKCLPVKESGQQFSMSHKYNLEHLSSYLIILFIMCKSQKVLEPFPNAQNIIFFYNNFTIMYALEVVYVYCGILHNIVLLCISSKVHVQ